jgi:hypothetical protein
MVRSIFIASVLLVAACSRADEQANTAEAVHAPKPPADLSLLEVRAVEIFDAQKKEVHEQERLLNATKKTMASTLFDPFSAHYQKIRAGRNGAICGQVNGKNRMGAYIGFKDFVIPRDRSDVFINEAAGGFTGELYSAFTSAYIASCANQQEVRLYNILTVPPPTEPRPNDDELMDNDI